MNFNLRQAVLANVQGNNEQEIQHTITDAIQSGEEKMLPGLGVLFEVLWQNSDPSTKEEVLSAIAQGLQK
ncbi:small acid-soluble spore protein SspI [Bacillus taeanensis]|uniref:Small, acid-soluble spore protein I n=1 Tax=Bacillus taeanensis TaxID=273032 RepID=A0A366XZE0_9BACI|nr:small acid-soluble spore protein SspI [Bacillus taeanensis]RBW71522.1 small acid-soluble spore protein SspI [Bacillus taeanensis]